MAILVHESAMMQNPERIKNMREYRMVTTGAPIGYNDTLIVGWDLRYKAIELLKNTARYIHIMRKFDDETPHQITNANIHLTDAGTTIVARTIKEFVKERKAQLYYTMPKNWTGRTWFKLSEVRNWHHYNHLLDTSRCTVKESKKYTSKNNYRNKSYYKNIDGKIELTLRQAIEKMGYNKSVLATVNDFPFEIVPRNYLTWLICDGKTKGGIMKTAIDEEGNSLRESIIYYLDSTRIFKKINGIFVDEEKIVIQKSYLCGGYEGSRQYIKQWERMDCEPRDLESKEFSTYGYWKKDTFIPCGTNGKVIWGSHGPATWIEKLDSKNDDSERLEHVENGLSEWERTEKWIPENKINLGWRPARDKDGKLKAPKDYIEAYKKLFENKQRLETWDQRMDWFTTEWKKGRSESDTEILKQDFIEHEYLLKSIELEYQTIYRSYKAVIPKEWGMKKDLEKAKSRRIEELENDLLDQMIHTEMIELQEMPVQEVKKKSGKAVDWKTLEEMTIPRHYAKSVRIAIHSAKKQPPKLKLKKGLTHDVH
jgi:hypothetical protein